MADQLRQVRQEIHTRIKDAKTEREKRVLELVLKNISVFSVNGAVSLDVEVRYHRLYSHPLEPETSIPEIGNQYRQVLDAIDKLNSKIERENEKERAIKRDVRAELSKILAIFGLTRSKPLCGPETYTIKRKSEQNATNKRRKRK